MGKENEKGLGTENLEEHFKNITSVRDDFLKDEARTQENFKDHLMSLYDEKLLNLQEANRVI